MCGGAGYPERLACVCYVWLVWVARGARGEAEADGEAEGGRLTTCLQCVWGAVI